MFEKDKIFSEEKPRDRDWTDVIVDWLKNEGYVLTGMTALLKAPEEKYTFIPILYDDPEVESATNYLLTVSTGKRNVHMILTEMSSSDTGEPGFVLNLLGSKGSEDSYSNVIKNTTSQEEAVKIINAIIDGSPDYE